MATVSARFRRFLYLVTHRHRTLPISACSASSTAVNCFSGGAVFSNRLAGSMLGCIKLSLIDGHGGGNGGNGVGVS